MRCAGCGRQEPVRGAFLKDPNRIAGRARTFCPSCYAGADRKHAKQVLLLFLILGGLGVVAGLFAPFPESTVASAWSLPLFLLFLVLFVAAHELGHFTAARLLGVRVFALVLGTGPVAWKRIIRGVTLELRWLPLSGYNILGFPRLQLLRTRYFLIVLGGPLVNLAALVGLAYTFPRERWWKPALLGGLNPAGLAMDANALLLAASLLPVRSRLRDLGRVASDGLALLRTPFLSDNDCRDRHAQYFALEANQCLSVGQARAAQCWLEQGLAKYPWQARLRLQMAHPWILRGEFGAARQILLPLVGRDDLDPQSRALVCDTIAWSDLMLGDPALLPEADALSQEAFEAVPDSHPFAGTRGAALIELERLDEGFVLLRRALVGNPDAYNKAVNLCYLGLREARRDDAEAARRYLDEARRLDPRCPVLERIARLVEARTASIVPDVVDVLPASPSAERRAPL